ncbi:kinase-like domain-containing protein, partial [Cunninghamella echinulata]
RIGNYFLEETLHKSEFGKIKLGIHTDSQQKFAIDVIKRNKVGEKISSVNQQIDILSSLKHPNIIKLIDTINTTKRIGIVLEYASGGDLFEYVLSRHSLEEEEAAKLFAQLINSVKYMHLKGVVHRDLKLENILFSDQEKTKLIVTNFGFANNEKKDLLSTSCGSPTYAAPELVFLETNGYHGPTADIWSCGVILYCMLCGYLPYDDDPENPESQNFHQLYRYIRTSTLSFPPYVSDKAQDLLRGMLHPDPSKRCTMDFITHHPWLSLYHDE